MTLKAKTVDRIGAIDSAAWNALAGGRFPHLRHEFLQCLEEFHCLGEPVGWFPRHLVFEDAGRLAAAMPMYLKSNSFGEFVFDWSWAQMYERAGLDYYPKLVVASPFTPATGPRLLTTPEHADGVTANDCIETVLELARQWGVSSCHWLFATDQSLLESPHLLLRLGCQFHWHNQGYQDFEHYLSFFTSKRRKQIRKERREVREAGIVCRRLSGAELGEREWAVFHRFYRNTFERHGNYPALTKAFFLALGQKMGDQVLLVLAEKQGQPIAAAFFLIGADGLYGRYWGCEQEFPSLHFEACYYQGLEYCIEHGLRFFEPGAQGEHKISRGFLPTPTWSAHWIGDPRFHRVIANFLAQETTLMRNYIDELSLRSPFRSDDGGD